jgi:hypothetical protein
MLGVALLLYITPLAAYWMTAAPGDFTRQDQWRGLLIPPTVILYILLVAPWMSGMDRGVLNSFRSFVLLDDESFQDLVRQAISIKLHHEILALGAGGLIGFISATSSTDPKLSFLNAYWYLTNTMMYALLVWTIYVSLTSTRLTSTLLRQPLKLDPFDITPFEPIGRQSLISALVFMGGITLSLVFVILDPINLTRPVFWLIYVPLVSVPVLLFFLNMLPTHKVLARAKASELETVRRHLRKACRDLLNRREENRGSENLPAEIHALEVYEKQLLGTRTWPYNTTMLRTLFFSVLFPITTVLLRVIGEVIFD